MEISSQTDYPIENINTKKKIIHMHNQRDKEFQNLNPIVELPSIRRNHKFFHMSNVSESPRLRPGNMISPTRFPSIFKKYQQAIDN